MDPGLAKDRGKNKNRRQHDRQGSGGLLSQGGRDHAAQRRPVPPTGHGIGLRAPVLAPEAQRGFQPSLPPADTQARRQRRLARQPLPRDRELQLVRNGPR